MISLTEAVEDFLAQKQIAALGVSHTKDDAANSIYRKLKVGYFSANARELYFGIGDRSRVDKITVMWPSGQIDSFTSINPNQTIYLIEGKKLYENTLVPSD